MAKAKATQAETPETGKRCAVTRKQWADDAPQTIVITVNGTTIAAGKRDFSSGSFGFYVNEKIIIMVGDTPVKFQCNLNMTAVNSGNEPK